MEKNQTPPLFPTLVRILHLAGRSRLYFGGAVSLDLLGAVFIVLQNHLLRGLFDSVIGLDSAGFYRTAMLLFGLAAIGIPVAFSRTRLAGMFSEKALYEIRQHVAKQLNRLPIRALEERHSGDFLSVVTADLARMKNLLSTELLDLLSQTSQGLGALIYILFISWQLTLVSLVVTPLLFILLSLLTGPITRRANDLQEETGILNSLAQDALNGLQIARAFNLNLLLEERFADKNQEIVRKGLSLARPRSLADSLSTIVSFTPFLITFGFGGYLAITGQMTFGSLFAFINLLNFVANPLSSIPRLIASIGEAVGASQRTFRILDQDREPEGGAVTYPSQTDNVVIRFKEVTFAYDTGTPVLKDVNLAVRDGERIAIVGPSGSGKSTLIKLIMGFYPLEEGRIELFGAALADWQLSAARQQVAFVSQEPYLFPVSIEQNIACGDLRADPSQIHQSAQAANIHEFIQSLTDGYQTMVGERGARLSGGQRQRISLARAILKNAPVLLLDEPTSALDAESEALVQEALERLMAKHTSIVIAHRLSTIKNADRILVLDGGRIVEEGTHEDLLRGGGIYLELYQNQFSLADAI